MRIPLAREGYPFIITSILVTILLALFGAGYLSALALGLAVFTVSFFRDPERDIPAGESRIVSPADGKVIKVERCMEDRFLGEETLKICIFMNLFNVHVNRIPASGTIKGIYYNSGRFFSANLDKASLENEQNALLIEADNGKRFLVIQIAGLVARRIVCYPQEGDPVERGKRFGMIRFGSRLDVYLPKECIEQVRIGKKVKAGTSVLALWEDK